MARRFFGSFTQQEPIPPEAVAAAASVLGSGRLHRYNLLPGEKGEVAALEEEYRDWQESRYCLAVTSGGQALQIALRAAGVRAQDPVLTNAFTLAPVPGAIAAVGGRAILVESDADLRLDFADLARKIADSGARVLLLSHMRGHLCDMERLMSACDAADVAVIEDCAHTMGARWNGTRAGNFGKAACFSTQTYKHLNSGEGGLLTTGDTDLAARATILSGSYMFYDRHGAGPDAEAFAQARYDMPNCSARMDALRAAILRPQLVGLERNIRRWNRRYSILEAELAQDPRIATIARPAAEFFVGSSIQFHLPGVEQARCRAFLQAARARGVELKWFGAPEPSGFTFTHRSWHYLPDQHLPRTEAVLATLFDMRLPLSFSEGDCRLIAALIREAAKETEAC